MNILALITSHTINQLEFLIFLDKHSLLGVARGLVTQWKAQLIIQVFFITKSTYKSKETHSLSQISFPTHPMLVCMWKTNQTSEVSLIQHTSQTTEISNDMQCSTKLNTLMTWNPQLWFSLYPINNIAIFFFFF